MNTNFLDEALKTITLNQLIERLLTTGNGLLKWGTQKWSVPLSMLSSAKNKQILDMQNPQPEQPLGTKGSWEREMGKEGEGSLWLIRQRKAAANR